MNDRWVINEHGVWGYWSHCGSMFGRDVTYADGTTRFQTGIPLFVPEICSGCPNFESGEYGEYGSLISGPYCTANIWFPIRRGTCKRGERDRQPGYLWQEASALRCDVERAALIAGPRPARTRPSWMAR